MIFSQNVSLDLESRIKALSQGVSGDPLVIEAQTYLRIMGFPIGNFGANHNGVDGQFGEVSRAAMQTFQIFSSQEPTDTLNTTTATELETSAVNSTTFRSLAEEAYQQQIQLPISIASVQAQFINAVYYNSVIDEKSSKVPAAVTTSQSILETGYGKSVPTDITTNRYSYNLFGIKGTGPAGSVISWTQEEDPKTGIWQPVRARFRAYDNFGESIKDHSQFFYDNIKCYGGAFQANTPANFAKAIAKAGYATDSNYAKKLILLMNYWGLS
jgi:flagellum-specific peptidoglycan hydrolase FlgJ